MAILIQTTGVHHLALRSADLARSRRFYAETLGFPLVLDADAAFVFLAGGTVVGVLAPDADAPAGDHSGAAGGGLDHLALATETDEEIARVARLLTEAGVENTGPKTDDATGKRYVAFTDPDGIWWELYRG
jgi:glyoxylase I family protein